MVLPKTYRKLVVKRFSRNFREATEIVETPLEMPGPGQVLVRNLYAGVNASDVNISAGVYPLGDPPFDVGAECSGEIVAIGDGVNGLKVGNHVTMLSLGSGYREYTLADAEAVVPIPKSSPETSGLIVAALTASVGLHGPGELSSGETVLITAAAGGVGSFAVQIAKQAGNHVIGTCSTAEKAATLKKLGCDRIINYKEEDLGDVLSTEYPDGINLVFENVGGKLFDDALDNLAVRGRLVINGFISEYTSGPVDITASRLYHKLLWQSRTARGFILLHYPDMMAEHTPRLLGQILEGDLVANIDDTEFKGIDAVQSAVEHLHSGKNNGKVIVTY